MCTVCLVSHSSPLPPPPPPPPPPRAGQHNDARMNLAIALTAAREGATIANHVEVLSLIKEGGVVRGAHVRDTLTSREWDVMAKVVVNATGEWTLNGSCDMDTPHWYCKVVTLEIKF